MLIVTLPGDWLFSLYRTISYFVTSLTPTFERLNSPWVIKKPPTDFANYLSVATMQPIIISF